MQFKITNPINNKVREISLDLEPVVGVRARHEHSLPFWSKEEEKETVAALLGLNYTNQEALRRSPEFATVVEDFIVDNSLTQDDETRKHLGVLPAERRVRVSNGRITKGQTAKVGQMFLDLVDDTTKGMQTDDTHL